MKHFLLPCSILLPKVMRTLNFVSLSYSQARESTPLRSVKFLLFPLMWAPSRALCLRFAPALRLRHKSYTSVIGARYESEGECDYHRNPNAFPTASPLHFLMPVAWMQRSGVLCNWALAALVLLYVYDLFESLFPAVRYRLCPEANCSIYLL